jgi:hypothetical protein
MHIITLEVVCNKQNRKVLKNNRSKKQEVEGV